MRVLLAGGGTAGHTSPLLATADALRRLDPDVEITCLGTPRGLENRVVPAAGYPLELIPPVPLPRRPSGDLLRVPGRLREAVRATYDVLDRVRPDVVVGYGGYVSMPAYLAARRRRLPLVVHEQNALPGLANKAGARIADRVAVSFPGTPAAEGGVRRPADPHPHLRARPRRAAGRGPRVLRPRPGPSDAAGHRRLAGRAAAQPVGGGCRDQPDAEPASRCSTSPGPSGEAVPADPAPGVPYVVVPFVDRMDLAYAAADLVVCRGGASSVTEAAAVGLPGIFVPLPIGNGEQEQQRPPRRRRRGRAPRRRRRPDASPGSPAPSPAWRIDAARLARMGAAAAALIPRDADEKLARIVQESAR